MQSHLWVLSLTCVLWKGGECLRYRPRGILWTIRAGTGSCIDVDSQTVNGTGYEAASYRFHHSRRQRLDENGWTTLPGTLRGENKLCVYTPVESGLYRMAGDVTIGQDGRTELRFSSNVLNL